MKDLVKFMQSGYRVALSELDKTLPFFVSVHKAELAKSYFSLVNIPELTEHISIYGASIVDKLESYLMSLENNRLPNQQTFILAVRAKCLAAQRSINTITKDFCRQFSLRATKSNTGLEFLGSGLKYLDESHTKIRGVMYSFHLSIPILDDISLPRFEIVNLGRFIESNRIKKAILPSFAIQSRSKTLEPLDLNACFNLRNNLICPSSAILAHNDCLQSIFDEKNISNCDTMIVHSQTSCQTRTFPKFLVVTSFSKSKVIFNSLRNRHIAVNRLINEFDIIERINFDGQFYCFTSYRGEKHMEPVNVPKTQKYVKSSFFDEYYQLKPNLTITLPDPSSHTLNNIINDLDNSQTHMIHTARETLELYNKTTNEFGSRLEKLEEESEDILRKWIHHIVTWIILLLIIGRETSDDRFMIIISD